MRASLPAPRRPSVLGSSRQGQKGLLRDDGTTRHQRAEPPGDWGSAREEGRTGHQSSRQHPQAVLGEGSTFSGEGRARTSGCTPQGGGFKVNARTKSSSLGRPESVGPDHRAGKLKMVSYFGGSSQGV